MSPVPNSQSRRDADFHTQKIHSIPKPAKSPQQPRSSTPRFSVQPVSPPKSARPRAESGAAAARHSQSKTPEFGALLSPKQMEERILSHYEQHEQRSPTQRSQQSNQNGYLVNAANSPSKSVRSQASSQRTFFGPNDSPKSMRSISNRSPKRFSGSKRNSHSKSSRNMHDEEEKSMEINIRRRSNPTVWRLWLVPRAGALLFCFSDSIDFLRNRLRNVSTAFSVNSFHLSFIALQDNLYGHKPPSTRRAKSNKTPQPHHPFNPPRSSPSPHLENSRGIRQIQPVEPLPNPNQAPRSYINAIPLADTKYSQKIQSVQSSQSQHNLRSNFRNSMQQKQSKQLKQRSERNLNKSLAPPPPYEGVMQTQSHQSRPPHQPVQPLRPPKSQGSAVSPYRPKSRTVGDYSDRNESDSEFLDDREVANKSFRYNRSLKKMASDPTNSGGLPNALDNEQYGRQLDKLRFKCDQLDWNLEHLQSTTDKDIRQITAKMHRVEHDVQTQQELHRRVLRENELQQHHPQGHHQRRNSIYDSLENSMGAVMRNVESIKDALQTLDLRMSIINQRQHDIFKHIDETKDILENAKAMQAAHSKNVTSDTVTTMQSQMQSPLVLNALDKDAMLTSRRASLQSMSEMLQLQTRHFNSESQSGSSSSASSSERANPLILPTYDDNEDILNPQSATKKKLMGHIRPELLLQTQQNVVSPAGTTTILPPQHGQHNQDLPPPSLNDVSSSSGGSGRYSFPIERTERVVTTPTYVMGMQLQSPSKNVMSMETLALQSSNSAENRSLKPRPSLKELGLKLKQLHSIVENGNDNLSSSESELSNERNVGPMSVPPMGDGKDENDGNDQRDRSVSSQRDIEQSVSRNDSRSSRRETPVTRRKRKGSKHVRSSVDSGIPNDVMEQIKYETMLIHSDSEHHGDDIKEDVQQQKSQNQSNGLPKPPNDSPSEESEDEEYLKNKQRRKRGKKRRNQSHSRSVNMSMDNNTITAIQNMDEMKPLDVPMVNTSPENRKYSESYSINVNQHHQAASTRAGGTLKSVAEIHSVPSPVKLTSVFGHVDSRRKRSGSYDIDVGQNNITPSVHYEREVSRSSNVALGLHDMDPLTLKNKEHQDANKLRGFSVQQNVQNVLLPPVSDDGDSEEEDEDVMSDLSDAANGNAANPTNPSHPNGTAVEDESEEDSVSELEQDSMSELSADHGTFIIHGDTLKNGLDAERLKEEQRQKEQNSTASKPQIPTKRGDNRTDNHRTEKSSEKSTKRKSSSRKLISLMNSTFILQIVPDTFTIINSFITQQLTQKPSYILTICNNTTSHDLFFKTSFVYNSRSKHLRYFKETQDREDMVDANGVVVIDDEGSDDHLAPMEEMTFGDIQVKKGSVYGGYFVFEAYPFLDMANSDGAHSHQPSSAVITPHINPVTPQKLMTNATLNAIDENNKSPDVALFGGFQCPELQLGSMNPSTVNKYRRQSLSSNCSRRTSLASPRKGKNENEMSVISLLGKALDEEQESVANLPWNDGLDDLIDVVIGYEVKLSVGDAELNEFRCFMRFNDYRQPLYYQNEFKGVGDLKEKCHGGSDGLQCVGGIDDKLQGKVTINDQHTLHPQIVFNIGYSMSDNHHHSPSQGSRRLSNHELVDID